MLRPAQAVLAAAMLVACGGTPTPPPPTRISDASQLPGTPSPPTSDKPSPFFNPTRESPPPRSGPQLPAAELKAVLAAAATAAAASDDNEVMRLLFTCANKVPKHIGCEGELGIVLAKYPPRKAEARYYLEQAIADDDPDASPDFYARLAATLRKVPMWPEAAVALQRRIERLPEPTAADYVALSELLQGLPKRTAEAAAALERAFELEPAQLDLLRQSASLLSQIPERRAEARTMLLRYRDAIRTTEPDKLAAVQEQLDLLDLDLRKTSPAAKAGPASAKKPRAPGAAAPSGR